MKAPEVRERAINRSHMYLTLNLIDALQKKLHIHITARYAHPRLRAFGQSLLGEQGKAHLYRV